MPSSSSTDDQVLDPFTQTVFILGIQVPVVIAENCSSVSRVKAMKRSGTREVREERKQRLKVWQLHLSCSLPSQF